MSADERGAGVLQHALFDALTRAADTAGIGVCIVQITDSGVKLAWANAHCARMVGLSQAELIERGVPNLIAAEDLPRLIELRERRLRGEGLPTAFETTLVHADGHRVPVELATSGVELEGRPADVTFLFDISHRKRAEEALRRSEARFRTLAESAPDGIAIMRWPTIVYLNAHAARLLGFASSQEAVGQNLLTRLRPTDALLAERRKEQRVRGEALPQTAEYRSRDIDGKERIVEVSATTIEYEGAPAVLGFARDVTDRRAMLSRLLEADKLAAVGTLAAGVAHEINNPLAYMLLNLEIVIRQLPKLAADPALLGDLQRRLEETRQGGERVKTIVRDLQVYTRRDESVRGPVALDAVIESALSLASHELRQHASVVSRLEPAPYVLGNATRFEQLFLNLAINAAHAVQGAPERNTIEFTLRPGTDDSVTATVRDHGVGMSPETLARVFEPFFTTKPLGVGTGLGLPICQGIVREAGGEILIESQLGVGTTVTVTLPAYRSTEATIDAPPISEHAESSERGLLLIVDDEAAVARSLAAALQDEHDVVSCSSAAQARAFFDKGTRFDVVLCDLMMPEQDGPSLHAYVKQHRPELADRFVFMTGGVSLPEATRFLDEVENPRVEKPFDLRKLRALLRELMNAHLSAR